jgi:hypothetical protein
MRKEFSGATINYVAGTQFLGHDAEPVPASALSVTASPASKRAIRKLDMSNINNPNQQARRRAHRTHHRRTAANLPAETASVKPLAIHWEGMLTAPETGDYNLGMMASGFFRMKLSTARASPRPTAATASPPSSAACIWKPASLPNSQSTTRLWNRWATTQSPS